MAENLKGNFKKHKLSATAPTHRADEKGTDSEDESQGQEEKNENKPSKPELAWEGLEWGKNA